MANAIAEGKKRMLEITEENGVALVMMRHGKVNAMSLEFIDALSGMFAEFAGKQDVRQVVLLGNDRVFSAGVDLKRLISEGADYLEVFLPKLSSLFLDAFNFPKPLIVGVTGAAVAGGCVLACAGDYRLIGEQAFIGVPELRVGVPFPSAGMEIMRWAARGPAFKAMISTGATYRGQQAVDAGLANRVVPSQNIVVETKKAIETFSVVPPKIFALTKQQMRLPVIESIRKSQELLGSKIDQLWHAAETRETIARYVAERLG